MGIRYNFKSNINRRHGISEHSYSHIITGPYAVFLDSPTEHFAYTLNNIHMDYNILWLDLLQVCAPQEWTPNMSPIL